MCGEIGSGQCIYGRREERCVERLGVDSMHGVYIWSEGGKMCGETGSGQYAWCVYMVGGRKDVWRDWEWAVCMVCVYGRREEWERGCVEEGVERSREACRTEAKMVNLPHLESRTVHHLQRLKQFTVDMQTSLTTPCPCTTTPRETYSRLSLLSSLPSSENQD